jgi:drug/metabolite transporter (DMT)-like permease
MLLLANLLWGLSFPLVKATGLLHATLVPDGGSWFAAVYTVAPRFLLATLVLLAFRPSVLRGATASEWRQGLILGLSGAAGMLLQNDALQYTAASTSAFLTQFYALLIPAWLAWRVRRLPAPPVWLACGLVLAGVAVLSGFHPFAAGESPLRFGRGEAETLLCSVFFMVQIFALERAEFAGNRTLPITFVMFAMANSGLPGTSGFVGEFMVILAAFQQSPWIAAVAAGAPFYTLAFIHRQTWWALPGVAVVLVAWLGATASARRTASTH